MIAWLSESERQGSRNLRALILDMGPQVGSWLRQPEGIVKKVKLILADKSSN